VASFYGEVFAAMGGYYWPVIIVVCSNTLYHICSKSTPKNADMFVSLLITYLVAAASSLVLYLCTSQSRNFMYDIKEINWASIGLGFTIFFIELGFIKMYRAGWDISVGSLVTNIAIALILIFIGLIFYREHLSLSQIIGVVLCSAGLIFINR
jgi:drug/metabolite transporter (DMT)-like permease